MASAALDHMLSLTIFIVALLLFIALFSNTIQSGIAYQQHNTMSTKTSDLLDTMLLNPGLPSNWSVSNGVPMGFGMQDPEFSQYKLSSFSTLRLASVTKIPVYYPRTNNYYSNLTSGFGSCLLTPVTQTINYSEASRLLGINGTYGFQLKLTPTVSIDIKKTSIGAPLQFSVSAAGTGFVMANANVTYNLILVSQEGSEYPSYSIVSGNVQANEAGMVSVTFSGVDGESRAYALIVYSYLYGLVGVGYFVHMPQGFTDTIIPMVDNFENRTIALVHSDSIGGFQNPAYRQLSYNSTFVILTEEYKLREVILDQTSATSKIDVNQPFASLVVPNNAGILIVAYKGSAAGEVGLLLVPWGLGALAYPITFGGESGVHNWVTTDIRQVTIGGLAYQAQLALWNLQGNSA